MIKVQQRWRNARDSYGKVRLAKRKQKPLPGMKQKKYIFYDQMRFLDKLEKLKTSESADTVEASLDSSEIERNSINESIQKMETCPESSEREMNNDNDDSKDVLRKLKPNRKYKNKTIEAVEMVEAFPEIFMEETNESQEVFKKLSPKETPKIRKRTNELSRKRLINMASKVSNSRNDDDLAFFTSLLSMVRQLNSRDKLAFRSRVMINLMEIYEHPNSISYTGASGSASSSRKTASLLNAIPKTHLEEMGNNPRSTRQVHTEVSLFSRILYLCT